MAIEAATRLPQIRKSSPYRQYYPGQTLQLEIFTPNSDLSVSSSRKTVTLGVIRERGFLGRELISGEEGLIIQINQPGPWFDLRRRVGWRLGNFARADRTQAQIDYQAQKLVHQTLPILSDHQMATDKPLGYTPLPTGFAQVLKMVPGRGLRFDTGKDEFPQFRQAQEVRAKIECQLGLIQATQRHESHPKDIKDLLFDPENNQWILTGTGCELMHPQRFFATIWAERHKFPDDLFAQILADHAIYERLWEQRAQQSSFTPDIKGAAIAGLETVRSFGGKLFGTFFALGTTPARAVWAAVNPEYGKHVLNTLTLKGAKAAYERNIITPREWQDLKTLVEGNQNGYISRVLLTTLAYHQASGWILKAPELFYYTRAFGPQVVDVAERLLHLDFGPLASSNVFQDTPTFALAFAGFRAFDAMQRSLVTSLIENRTGVNMKTAAKLSRIPLFGGFLAVPSQLAVSTGIRSEMIWHLTVRNLVSKLALGGASWENWLWQHLGKHLEKLATFEKQK